MKKKINVWKIVGYRGYDDYDGPDDNNVDFTILLDSYLSPEAVHSIAYDFILNSSKNRITAISYLEKVKTIEVKI